MAFLKPLFDSRRRTDFSCPEPCVESNPHNYTYQTPPLSHTSPQKPYAGANHRDNYDTYQTPPVSHTPPRSPYGGANRPHTKPASSPMIVDDAAAATIEWRETPEAHIFKTNLPKGVRREDVRVQIEDDQVLKIMGERVTEAEEGYNQGKWRRVEVSRGTFVTSLKLPEDAMADLIKSYWENGALTVKIPRREMVNRYGHHVRNVDIINDHRY